MHLRLPFLFSLVLLITFTGRLSATPEAWQPPREISERGLRNVQALARVVGLVRYFHPSDEAAFVGLLSGDGWDHLVLRGILAVEDAATDEELATRLQQLVQPFAPTVRVAVSGDDQPPRGFATRTPAPERPVPDSSVYWQHSGHGRADRAGYYSDRIFVPLTDESHHENVPAPGEVLVDRLTSGDGGAVWCAVPMRLYALHGRTFPAATEQLGADFPRLHMYWTPSGNDRTSRIAAIIQLWNVIQHFYPYFDEVDVDWEGDLVKWLQRAATDENERAFLHTLRRMLATLRDGHGVVFHACDPRTHTLPLSWSIVEGELVITGVAPEAAQAVGGGPKRGDIVRMIDGRNVRELIEWHREMTSAATETAMRFRITQELLFGGPGERVSLHVERADESEAVFDVQRVRRTSSREVEAFLEPRPHRITEMEPGLWYIDGNVVQRDEVFRAMRDLADARGIILDLRGYPRTMPILEGNLSGDPVRSPPILTPIVRYPDGARVEFDRVQWTLPPMKPRLTSNFVVLMNGQCVSAAETLLSLIEDAGVATFVGEQTAGTNGGINPTLLPGGYRVVWTGMKVLRHDESPHHGVGITPNIEVQPTIAGIRAGRDEVLEAGRSAANVRAN